MNKPLVMGVINRPCGHSMGVVCDCVRPSEFVTTTTTASFVWNGPLQISKNGGYEPAPLHLGGQINKETR